VGLIPVFLNQTKICSMIDFLLNPWPWWFSGALIAGVMLTMNFFGKAFGISSNLRTVCAAVLRPKAKFFDFDWRKELWNLVFLGGSVVGGFVAYQFLTAPGTDAVQLASATVADLQALGFTAPEGMQPNELFGPEAWANPMTWLILVVGGFLVGFGTRYAGGCTSGHAISGLSNLQLPSLIAVIGFFAGGLLVTHFIFPLIF
jgi:uncharacterized membrane protein YedE/YeeE